MSIFTFVASVVAAGTTVYIAKKVYSEQKEKDRALQLRSEKRQAYRDFFNVTARLSSYLRGVYFERRNEERRDILFRNAQDCLPELYVALDVLALKCASEELAVVTKYYDAIMQHRAHLWHELFGWNLPEKHSSARDSAEASRLVAEAKTASLAVARKESLMMALERAQADLEGYAQVLPEKA